MDKYYLGFEKVFYNCVSLGFPIPVSKKNQQIKEVTSGESSVRIPWWHLVVLGFVVFICFGNTVKNGYNMDDDLVTSTGDWHHPTVEKGIKGIPTIFKKRYVDNGQQNYAYRPVTTATFAIEYSIWGDKPVETRASVGHFLNLLLYIFDAILVYLVLFKLFKEHKRVIAFIGTLLFVIHPLHSEVVNNIKCRDELLTLFFGFTALLVFLKYARQVEGHQNRWLLVLGFMLVALSALSKKNGVVFVITIPLVLYYFTEVKLKLGLKVFVSALLGAILLGLMSKLLLDDVVARDKLFFENPLYEFKGLGYRIPMFFYTIAWYVKMLIVPYPLSFYYGYDQLPLAGWGHPMVWFGCLFVIGLTALSLYRIKKKEVGLFGFLFFMFSIGGISNLTAIAPGIVAERFAFIPSFGFIIAVTYYGVHYYYKLSHRNTYKMSFIGGLVAVVIVSFGINISRNQVWKDKITLYSNDLQHLTKSAKAHSLLGQEYLALANKAKGASLQQFIQYTDSSITVTKKALEIYPSYWTCANNIAYAYQIHLLQLDSSLKYYQKAIEIKPDYPQAQFGLASIYAKKIDAIDRVYDAFKYVAIDSTAPSTMNLQGLKSEIFNAGYFEVELINAYLGLLQSKGSSLINPQVQTAVLNEMKGVTNNFLFMEKGILSTQFDFNAEIFNPTSEALKMINEANIGEIIATIDKGVKYKFNVFNSGQLKAMAKLSSYTDLEELYEYFSGARLTNLEEAKVAFAKAIESKPSEVRYYEEYTKFLHKMGLEEDFIKVNLLGVQHPEVKHKTQLLVNLANIYNFRKEYEKALEYTDAAFLEASNSRKEIEKNTDLEVKGKLLVENTNSIKGILQLGIIIAEVAGNPDKKLEYEQRIQKY